ncbi:MAG: hypothetical protein J4F41_09505 [Alphaproteobacteria bacterium]|nr:hypothetical protein [Alphaproteobacteria bacterium]
MTIDPGYALNLGLMLAEKIGVSANTRKQWRLRGYIPPSSHHAIIKEVRDAATGPTPYEVDSFDLWDALVALEKSASR